MQTAFDLVSDIAKQCLLAAPRQSKVDIEVPQPLYWMFLQDVDYKDFYRHANGPSITDVLLFGCRIIESKDGDFHAYAQLKWERLDLAFIVDPVARLLIEAGVASR